MKVIAQGAEAKIYSDGKEVKKERFEKTYRHPELDRKLRKFRTRREAKILTKLAEANFPAPKLVNVDDKSMEVRMEHLDGKMVKEVIDDLEKKGDEQEYLKVCKEIGLRLAELHNLNIIHHDMTTSNMIYKDDQVYFIDFGLSFFSEKVEDKAVDLHLLRHALESRHHRIFQKCFEVVKVAYGGSVNDSKDILNRLDTVEKRGRYKHKQ